MHSRAYNYALAVSNRILRRGEVRYHQQFNSVASESFNEFSATQPVFRIAGQTNTLEHELAVGVGVGVAVSKVNLIVCVVQLD